MTADCPVCRRRIPIGTTGTAWRHRDKAGNNCPMSGHQYPNDDMEEVA